MRVTDEMVEALVKSIERQVKKRRGIVLEANSRKVCIDGEFVPKAALSAAARVRAEANAGGPVAWGEDIDGKIVSVRLDKSRHCTVPLYPAPQPSGPVKALVEQIDSLLALNKNGSVSQTIPGLALELLERARAALSAEQQMTWRPIETAPKDGTEILSDGPHGVVIIHWMKENYFGDGAPARWFPVPAPTRWMPLPAAPTAGGGDE